MININYQTAIELGKSGGEVLNHVIQLSLCWRKRTAHVIVIMN
jgi:hypothetical protein